MKKLAIILSVLMLSFTAYAQNPGNQGNNVLDKLYFGGGFGLSAGSWGTSVSVSPIVGYRLIPRVSVGVGASYTYYKFQSGIYDYSDNRWGGQVFTQVALFKNLFGWLSYEFINYSYNGDQNDRRVAERVPLGLGYRMPLGRRGAFNVLGAYDLLHTSSSAYRSPWIFTFFFTF